MTLAATNGNRMSGCFFHRAKTPRRRLPAAAVRRIILRRSERICSSSSSNADESPDTLSLRRAACAASTPPPADRHQRGDSGMSGSMSSCAAPSMAGAPSTQR
eukprot:scaffold19515_cov31-Tisochrysis_lutea.AAC.5